MTIESEQPAERIICAEILGVHPEGSTHPFALLLSSSDIYTETNVPHRAISEVDDSRNAIIECLRELIIRHHVSSEAFERDRLLRETVMRELGFEKCQERINSRFPTNIKTQKGNLAEIILAEYLVLATRSRLPIYRLRYNPNINQAMKGNDVLTFDFDSIPVRIIVGESKFRSISTKVAVTEIIDDLDRAFKGGVPLSLHFVAEILYNAGDVELGDKVEECSFLFLKEQLRIDYVGLLMSDTRSADRINEHTAATKYRLAMISLGVDSPDSIIPFCYTGLEE